MPDAEKCAMYQWQWAALAMDWITAARRPDIVGYANELVASHADDLARYRAMADEFSRFVAARPWSNHCIVARDIGARAFGFTPSELLKEDRSPDLVEARHKIIAFTRVVTGANASRIGKAFERHHPAVTHACAKYEHEVRAAIRRRDE